ncbi:MAG: cryptochrome/photolyase family protein [Nanoarchaeota archaeon]
MLLSFSYLSRKPRSLPKAVSFEGLEGYDRLSGLKEKLLKRTNPHIACHGGRLEALSILDDLDRYSDYAQERNIPSHDATTKLSAHHKFGTVSIRESFHAMKETLGEDHPLLRQLYWRDFFTGIAYYHPRVFAGTFQDIDETGLWDDDADRFKRWCDGMTGFPLIDAGMRQLVKTGYMHNRLRMATASFLTKDLHIDWRWGERFFANHLIDYDPSVNNASWQWAASTGSDAQPYFRIFNPWRQQKRFDPDGEYIRKWVDELGAVSGKDLLDIEKKPVHGYPSPIIDHKVERDKTLERFKARR